MDFDRDGARRFEGALSATELDALRSAADAAVGEGPGARLLADPEVTGIVSEGAPARVAKSLIGQGARPVRAVFFDKTAKSNWSVGWHQDRIIVVKARKAVEGFGPWSARKGLIHVTPPGEVLAKMATLRIHLDPCRADNAPLVAALGTHAQGYVPTTEAGERASEARRITCLAEAGDIWAYRTPILHSSARAAAPARRRVLQVDYSADALPGGLEWRGIAA